MKGATCDQQVQKIKLHHLEGRHLSSTQKNPHPHFQVTSLHTQKLRKEIPKSHSSRKVALTEVRSKWQWPEILGESTSIVIIFQEGKKKSIKWVSKKYKDKCQKHGKTISHSYRISPEFCRKQYFLYNIELESFFLSEFSSKTVTEKENNFLCQVVEGQRQKNTEEIGN